MFVTDIVSSKIRFVYYSQSTLAPPTQPFFHPVIYLVPSVRCYAQFGLFKVWQHDHNLPGDNLVILFDDTGGGGTNSVLNLRFHSSTSSLSGTTNHRSLAPLIHLFIVVLK